jgi:hypothetical protein
MMKIERLSRKEAIEAMNSWIANSFALPTLGKDYAEIRNDLVTMFSQSQDEAEIVQGYEMDVCFGAALFGYMKQKPWFTDRLASDDGFWRYLSLRVVPDLVGERWGNTNADHYYTKPSRIWLKTMWWYFYLSFNKDVETTKEMLLSEAFSTDTILNLVERTGRSGTNISVYRNIMSKYASLEDVSDKVFRSIMKLNTVKAVVIEPVFSTGGVSGYVDSLFNELSLNE